MYYLKITAPSHDIKWSSLLHIINVLTENKNWPIRAIFTKMLWHRFERDWIYSGNWFEVYQIHVQSTNVHSIPSNTTWNIFAYNNDNERKPNQSALMKQHWALSSRTEFTCQCNCKICVNERIALAAAFVLCNIFRVPLFLFVRRMVKWYRCNSRHRKETLFLGTCKQKTLNNGTKYIYAECGLLKIEWKTANLPKSHLHFVLGPIYSAKQIISFSILFAFICLPQIFSFLSKIFAFGESGWYCYRI